MLLYQIVECTIHRKIFKNSYRNNKFEIFTWNEKFELPDGSHSISDV